jgi:hypothetical protein
MTREHLPILKVTKGSSDGTIKKGDFVYYGNDGSLVLIGKRGGWIEADELKPDTTDFEYEIDDKHEVIVTKWGEVVTDKVR